MLFFVIISCDKNNNFRLKKNIDTLITSDYIKIKYKDFVKQKGGEDWEKSSNKRVYKYKNNNHNYIYYEYDTIRQRDYMDSIYFWYKKNSMKVDDDLKPKIRKSLKVNNLYVFSNLFYETKQTNEIINEYLFYDGGNSFCILSYSIIDVKNNEKVELCYNINNMNSLRNNDINILLSKITNLSLNELNDVIISVLPKDTILSNSLH